MTNPFNKNQNSAQLVEQYNNETLLTSSIEEDSMEKHNMVNFESIINNADVLIEDDQEEIIKKINNTNYSNDKLKLISDDDDETAKCSIDDKNNNNNKSRARTIRKNKTFHAKHMIIKYPLAKINQDELNQRKIVIDGRIFYNCKECGKSLHSMYTFVWHMRIHTGERPYLCNLCNKEFRVSQGLVRHLKETHEQIKNFDCDICGRFFATKRNVEEHRRIHTNERPYICDICGKTFKQKASLFVHKRSHSSEFPFVCSTCLQKFRTKPALLVHSSKHTGEKSFSCDICGRYFRIKYELKQHKLIHSEIKPFSCKLCSQTFRQKRYLRNHLKLNHSISNPTEFL